MNWVLVGANDVAREPSANDGRPSNGAHKTGNPLLCNGVALLGHVEAGQGIRMPRTPEVRPALMTMVTEVIDSGQSLDAAMGEIEAAVIRAALKQQLGNRSAAARQLQLPRQTLQDRMKKHGLWSS